MDDDIMFDRFKKFTLVKKFNHALHHRALAGFLVIGGLMACAPAAVNTQAPRISGGPNVSAVRSALPPAPASADFVAVGRTPEDRPAAAHSPLATLKRQSSPTTPPQTPDDETGASMAEAGAERLSTEITVLPVSPTPPPPPPEPKVENEVATTVMDTIVWQIQTGQPLDPLAAVPAPPAGDPSLRDEALEAAFALLSRRDKRVPGDTANLLPKADGVTRVGVLVPLTGTYANLGMEIRRGIEMALFKIGNPNIEILFFDTKGGESATAAATAALSDGVDIFVGPLFSESVMAARAAVGNSTIPMLTLSNNIEVASANNWIMGYLPEQQLDGLLGHAIASGNQRFAVIVQDSAFGRRLWAHTNRRLTEFGLKVEAERLLTQDELMDEASLKRAIRQFSRYVRTAEKAPLPPSPFDVVVFAGDPDFALRTAPVLAYYDLGPDRALYLGNALWAQPQILVEPSLQGGLFTSRPTALDNEFESDWSAIWKEPPGLLSRLGFDAMAVVAALAQSNPEGWSKQLVSAKGFRGYSGAFRLLPDGGNVRAFELRRIGEGGSSVIKPAPDRI